MDFCKVLLKNIENELIKNIDPAYHRKTHIHLEQFKDYYGVRTSINRAVSAHFYDQVKKYNTETILKICLRLLESGIHEKKTIAFDWVYRLKDSYPEYYFALFESWLNSYVNNYGLCDDLCTHALGEVLYQQPVFLTELSRWIHNENFWFRRAAAVVLIYLAPRLEVLEISLNLYKKLFEDSEMLVQKGWGWLLKELSQFHEEDIFIFLNNNKKLIPRVTVRN